MYFAVASTSRDPCPWPRRARPRARVAIVTAFPRLTALSRSANSAEIEAADVAFVALPAEPDVVEVVVVGSAEDSEAKDFLCAREVREEVSL